MYEIFFSDSEEKRIEDLPLLKEKLDGFIKALNAEGDFSITFVSDDEIRKLNSEYRGKDEATDVLTFRLQDDDSFPQEGFSNELGDVFISIDSVDRNASSFSVSRTQELERVMLHGLMHLLGYDHESNDFSKEEMLIKQEQILKEMGCRE